MLILSYCIIKGIMSPLYIYNNMLFKQYVWLFWENCITFVIRDGQREANQIAAWPACAESDNEIIYVT